MVEVPVHTSEHSVSEVAVSDRVFTLANGITFVRLCLIPIALWLLLSGNDIPAAVLFGITAITDFLDGMVARSTNTVTKLGQLLDPLVDRALIIGVVLGLLLVGRLPLWIVVLVLLRDAYLLICGYYLMHWHDIRVPVSYIGKVGMWFLCVGFGGLILNMPILDGLALVSTDQLPGFGPDPYCAFIWFAYIGIVLSLTVTVLYTYRGHVALSAKKREA